MQFFPMRPTCPAEFETPAVYCYVTVLKLCKKSYIYRILHVS